MFHNYRKLIVIVYLNFSLKFLGNRPTRFILINYIIWATRVQTREIGQESETTPIQVHYIYFIYHWNSWSYYFQCKCCSIRSYMVRWFRTPPRPKHSRPMHTHTHTLEVCSQNNALKLLNIYFYCDTIHILKFSVNYKTLPIKF